MATSAARNGAMHAASAVAGSAVAANTAQAAVVGVPTTSIRSLMATRGPRPGSSIRRIQVLIAGHARRCDQGVRAGSASAVTPPAHTLRMVLTIAIAALGVAAVLALAYVIGTRASRSGRFDADERVTAALEQQAALLAQQAAQLEARLGMEREHTVTAAADMAAKMAGEKLGDSMTSGTRQLDLRTTAFEKRVEGLTTQLERLGDVVGALQKEGAQHHGQLLSGLKEATSSTRALAETTGHLREALASPKARGQWGERMADDVLRLAGMVEGVTYRKQTGITGGAIPDVTFLLPGGRVLHMDVKFPVDNYLRHLEASTDAERDTFAKAFLRDVRGRVKELSTRTGYIDADATLDEVLLFIPNESVWAFIHERDPQLIDVALDAEGGAVLAGESVRRARRDPAGGRADAPGPHQQRDPGVPRRVRPGVGEVLRRRSTWS